MQAASSDWTNVIIPGSEPFVPGEQRVKWVLEKLSTGQFLRIFLKVAPGQPGRRYQL